MSDGNEQPAAEVTPPGGPVPVDPRAPSADPQSNPNAADTRDLIAELKRHLEQTRLPADERERILADLPSPEERERFYREMMEGGGLSAEEFFASLGLDAEPKP